MLSPLQSRINDDFEQFKSGMPQKLEDYILDRYGISLATHYGIHRVKNPFGKASGQLSLNVHQIERDLEAGLGFVVLKTLIAEDAQGSQSMKAWAIPETHMAIETVTGTRKGVEGDQGWTVTWKGRGWCESMDEYMTLFDEALEIAGNEMLIVPSVKYHLPAPEETEWRLGEYEYTTNRLLDIWAGHQTRPMPIEKDFSPTLAGDLHYSQQRERILLWLGEVPRFLRRMASSDVVVGLKLFNAMMSDEFQLEMLEYCGSMPEAARADYLIYGNRLFSPDRVFEEKQGVAFGGPDLSDRNLAVLAKWKHHRLPLSATGNITSGRTAFEYLKRGATSFQMHTLFQLPDSEFTATHGNRTQRALHKLLFDPIEGLLFYLTEAKEGLELKDGVTIPQFAEALRKGM